MSSTQAAVVLGASGSVGNALIKELIRNGVRVLGRSPASTASGISSTLGMHPSTLTGILSRLERQRLIERKSDDVDRRRMRFRLTRKGIAIDRERKGTVEAAVRRALARGGEVTVQHTLEMFEIMIAELVRED